MKPDNRSSRILFAVLLPILLSIGLATRSAHAQTTRYVDPFGAGWNAACQPLMCGGVDLFACGYPSIQCALNVAAPNDVILINQGFYPGGNDASTFPNARNLRVSGVGRAVIDCAWMGAFGLQVNNNTTVDGLHFMNCNSGLTNFGGASNISVSNCRFQGNLNAILFNAVGGGFVVSRSIFRQNASGVGFRDFGVSNVSVFNNTFENNANAIALSLAGRGVVDGNIFSGNVTGIVGNGAAAIVQTDFNDYFQNNTDILSQGGAQITFGPNDLRGATATNPNFVDPANGVYLLQPLVMGNLNPLLNAGPIINGQRTNIGAYGAGVGVGATGANRFNGWLTSSARQPLTWTPVAPCPPALGVPVCINGGGNLVLDPNAPNGNGWVRSPIFDLNATIGNGLRLKTVRGIHAQTFEDTGPGTGPGLFRVLDIDGSAFVFPPNQRPLADNPDIAALVLNSPTRSREVHVRVDPGTPPACLGGSPQTNLPPFDVVFNNVKFQRDSGNPNARSVGCVQLEFNLSAIGP